MTIPSFEEYLESLSNLATVHDPTLLNAEGATLKVAADASPGLDSRGGAATGRAIWLSRRAEARRGSSSPRRGFNSTGCKLTDAIAEIERMAEVRIPTQFVFAAIDGIGWKSRQADLRRIHQLWVDHRIDGMFNLSTLDRFRAELEAAAHRLGLL